jgi:hypothetical protein
MQAESTQGTWSSASRKHLAALVNETSPETAKKGIHDEAYR